MTLRWLAFLHPLKFRQYAVPSLRLAKIDTRPFGGLSHSPNWRYSNDVCELEGVKA